MDIKIKQVSSLETIFSYETAANIEKAAVFGGERYSYQVVILPENSFRYQIDVKAPGLGSAVTLYKMKDAVMDLPISSTDEYSVLLTKEPGLMPDILVPAEDENNRLVLKKNDRQILWVRIDVPHDIPAGTYPITLEFLPLKAHCWEPVAENPSYTTFNIEVLPYALPEQTLKYTQWFYADCIADYYEVPVYSERHWELIDTYLRAAADTGINVILTPVITPPLDTASGLYRTNVQLVDIKVDGEKYIFNFDKLDRWIDICHKHGIKYFEISQLFSQWGLKFTPGITAEVNGRQEYIFGWHIYACDQRYADFLKQFIPALVAELKKKGVYEDSIFHISDEPHDYCLEAYKYAHDLLRPMLSDAKFMDALSDYTFFEQGLVDIPATYTAAMDDFIGKDVKEQWVYYAEDRSGISIRLMAAPPYRNRSLGIQLYKYDIKGFLHWGFNFYNTSLSFHKINPYLTTSAGKTMASGGNFSIYPGADGALLSPRALVFYEGLQDLAACRLLEKYVGREEAIRIIEEEAGMEITFTSYPQNSDFLPKLRLRIAKEIAKATARQN